jgi:endonuclease III
VSIPPSARAAVETLRNRGWEIFRAPASPVRFTGDAGPDSLLNDLEHYPHAFVIASVCDRQDSAERVWRIPYELGLRIGSNDFAALAALSEAEVAQKMAEPRPLHRFTNVMAVVVFRAVLRIRQQYQGDASRLWGGSPSSAALISAFLGFHGVGVKIASMAANILVREMKVPVSDMAALDVSPDVHVQRVFGRIGLTGVGASPEEIVYAARSASPDYPGVLDLGAWEVGRQWCRPTGALCQACYLGDGCPSVGLTG